MKVIGESNASKTKMQSLAGRRLFALHPFSFPFHSCLETRHDAWRHSSHLGAMSVKAIAVMMEQRRDDLGSQMSPLVIPPAQDCPHL